jgi:hypothetical protein
VRRKATRKVAQDGLKMPINRFSIKTRWWIIKQKTKQVEVLVGCNRLKSPKTLVHLKFMSQFYGDVNGSQPIDDSHLTL